MRLKIAEISIRWTRIQICLGIDRIPDVCSGRGHEPFRQNIYPCVASRRLFCCILIRLVKKYYHLSKHEYWVHIGCWKLPNILKQIYRFLVIFYCLPYKARPGHALKTFVRGKSSKSTAIWWLPNRHEWLRGDLFGRCPNMSPVSTYAKSFIKLPLDKGEAGSLKLIN